MKRLALFLLFAGFTGGVLTAQEPYQYTDVKFNLGMNPAAGAFFVGEGATDVINALWDNTGFMYARGAFKRFNGTQRSLGATPTKGLYRFTKTGFPPDQPALARFLASESLYVFSDSSITDTSAAFKKEGIGFHGAYFDGTGALGDSVFELQNTTTSTDFEDLWQRLIPPDPFFKTIDSAQFLRANRKDSTGYFGQAVMWLGANQVLINPASGNDSFVNYRVRAALDPGAQTLWAQLGNELVFGDSTKPLRSYYGVDTGVVINWICDTTSDPAVDTKFGDGRKAWFTDEWVGYWIRMAGALATATRNGVTRAVAPFAPITANEDTTLYLRFDPGTDGDAFIMSYPIEIISKPYEISNRDGANAWFELAGLPSYWTSLWANTNSTEYRNVSYPLECFFDSTGQIRKVDYLISDTLFFTQDVPTATPLGNVQLILHRPIIPLAMKVHQDRLWVIDVAYPNRVYYSEPLSPGRISPTNYLDVFPRDGDRGTALVSYKDQLLFKKGKSISRIVGDNPSNFVVLPFLENIGTAGPNAQADFGGEHYFYDGNTGIYVLREFNAVNLSDNIKPLLDSIPAAAKGKVQMAIHGDNLWMAYAAGAGATKNNRLISMNIRLPGTWARHDFARAGCFSVWNITGDSLRLMLGDPDSGTVYSYVDTATVDAGKTVRRRLTYKSGWMALSRPEERKRLRGLQLAFDADTIAGSAGDVDTCYLYKNFSTAAFDTLLFQRAGQLNNYADKGVNGSGYGRFFQAEWRVAPRTTFRFNYGRKKFTVIGF